MKFLNCPNCSLINPPRAQRCDCGYDFKSHEMRRPYVQSNSTEESACATWVYYWLAVELIAGVILDATVGSSRVAAWSIALVIGISIAYGIVFLRRLHGTHTTNPTGFHNVMDEIVIEEENPTPERDPRAWCRVQGATDILDRYYQSPRTMYISDDSTILASSKP